MNDLEPDQREQLTALVYDPTRADQAAIILADSGKSASQIARLMRRLAFDPTTIRDTLLTPTPADPEQTTLFTPDETRDALDGGRHHDRCRRTRRRHDRTRRDRGPDGGPAVDPTCDLPTGRTGKDRRTRLRPEP